MKRLHLIISGRVQGVAFRANTQHQAENLGLTGWVKNLPDGSVEIVAEGESAKIAVFETWCRLGPNTARVDQVKKQESEVLGEFMGFSIQY